MKFELRYDTPVYAVEIIFSKYVMEIGASGLIRLIIRALLHQNSRMASKYILAEIINTPVCQDAIDELNLPLLPFFIKRFTTRYAISKSDIASRKEHVIYLLSALQDHLNIDLIEKVNHSDISDSFYWLLKKEVRNSNFITHAADNYYILLAEALAHNGANRRSHMKSLLYWHVQHQHGELERSQRSCTLMLKILKDELAWLELIEMYTWMEKYHIEIESSGRLDTAWVLFQLGRYQEAQKIYALVWIKSKNEEAFRKQARCLEREGKWKVAIDLIQNRLPDISDFYAKAKLLRTLGWCYVIAGEPKKTINVSTESLQIFTSIKPKSKDLRYNIARAYNNLGAAYELMDELNAASSYHSKSLTIMKKLRVWKWVSGSALNKAIVLRKKGNFKQSLKSSHLAKRIKHSIMDFDEMPVILYNEALTFILSYFKSNDVSDLINANKNLKQAYQLRTEQGSWKQCAAILSLGYIAEYLLENTKESDNTCFFRDEFSTNIKSDLMANYEKDKQPLIAKALFLYKETTLDKTTNKVPPEIIKLSALAIELPTVEHIIENKGS
ncbi:MAG: tetratricopeptide repeat protein [Mariprofundaceae bacterium]|nr:tetratricopeptide repeat protein [Mariprofundaceae bacterium]